MFEETSPSYTDSALTFRKPVLASLSCWKPVEGAAMFVPRDEGSAVAVRLSLPSSGTELSNTLKKESTACKAYGV